MFLRSLALLLAATLLVSAQGQSTRLTSAQVASARTFVQKFYNNYLPLSNHPGVRPPWITAIKTSPKSFDPTLTKLLMDDARASAKSKNEIVGLDFDPFLNSQDPAQTYIASTVNAGSGTFYVQLDARYAGMKPERGVVTAVLKPSTSGWVFINFLYGKESSLISVLKQLKKERSGL